MLDNNYTEEKLYTLTNLQGSQTEVEYDERSMELYTLTNLQGSQTYRTKAELRASFTPLLTYKVLKPQIHRGSHRTLRPEIAVSFSFKDK